jgi:hypothetical protein
LRSFVRPEFPKAEGTNNERLATSLEAHSRNVRLQIDHALGIGPNREAVTRFALRLDMGKMDIQLIANEEKQDRAESGKNEAGGMITFVSRARKHVGNGAADDRTDNAEHDRPEDR